MEQDLNLIKNFNTLSAQSLELLRQQLHLRMSSAELLYCAHHYQNRGNGDISEDELRFIDALARPEKITLDKIAIGEMLTDHAYIADTFADAISKLKALGKQPEQPFTMQDIADLSVRYTAAVHQQNITKPVGFGGTAAQYAAQGLGVQSIPENDHPRIDVLQPLGLQLSQQATYADALVLLCPAEDVSSEAFDQAIFALLSEECGKGIHCICDVAQESVAHAVLRVTAGAVLNLESLPEQMDTPQALAVPHKGILIALPQNAAPALSLWVAQSSALYAYEIGIVDHAGFFILKRGKDTLFIENVPYLKSVCFIRSYTLRLDDLTEEALPVALPLRMPDDADKQTYCAALSCQTTFRAAVLGAMRAYCTAVAAGCDPKQIWLHANVLQQKHNTVSKAASPMLCALLGLYRFSMELGVPVQTDAAFVTDQSSILTLASAPDHADNSPMQQNGGRRIYLLTPAFGEDGMPVYSELRALIAYLHRAMLDGTIKRARFICGSTPAEILAQEHGDATLNPYNMHIIHAPCLGGFLAEADAELAGELIAVSKGSKSAQNDVISDNIS